MQEFEEELENETLTLRERRELRKQNRLPERRKELKKDDIVPMEYEANEIDDDVVAHDIATLDKRVQEVYGLTEKDIVDIIENPSPEGYLSMEIGDKIIDLNTFERYVLSQIPKKSLSTILRYKNAKIITHMKGYDNYLEKVFKKKR